MVLGMALRRYFSPSLPKKVISLTKKEVEEATAGVRQALKDAERSSKGTRACIYIPVPVPGTAHAEIMGSPDPVN